MIIDHQRVWHVGIRQDFIYEDGEETIAMKFLLVINL